MTASTPPSAPFPEPPDVPAELDLSRRRPRRRPPAQSEIRGINTIASLPDPDADRRDAAGGRPARGGADRDADPAAGSGSDRDAARDR